MNAESAIARETARRRTFAIISHPDAGKTTLTEKLLLFAGAIHIAGSVKARKATRHATSDWMEIEKQRGISVASSVMQMEYRRSVINLLDYKTPENPHPDVCTLVNPGKVKWQGLHELYGKISYDAFQHGLTMYRAAWKKGMNPDIPETKVL